jgi:hypothetical protein
LGTEAFSRLIEMTCQHLQLFNPYFWEDTDRGNLNIYYTPYKHRINQFKELLTSRIHDDNGIYYELDTQDAEMSTKELERFLGLFQERMKRYLHLTHREK